MSASSASSSRMEAIQRRVISVLQLHSQGMTEEELQREFKDLGLTERMNVLNALIATKRVSLMQDSGQIVYKLLSEDLAKKFSELSQEDMIVYQLIERGGNMGIWQKDIKFRSRLQPRQITKCIKNLMKHRLIKSVNTIHGKRRIVYMLADIEPSKDLTGGIWYTGTEYNTQLIQALQEEVCNYVYTKKFALSHEILDHVRKRGVSGDVDLREEEMRSIINALIYDGLIEEMTDQNRVIYKPCGVQPPELPYVKTIPCVSCPIFDKCTDDGDINPKTCLYLKSFLEF